ITTCLHKDPRERFQCAQDLKLQLTWLRQSAKEAISKSAAEPATVAMRIWAVAATLLFLVAAAAVGLLWLRIPEPASLEAFFFLPERVSSPLTNNDAVAPVVLSP